MSRKRLAKLFAAAYSVKAGERYPHMQSWQRAEVSQAFLFDLHITGRLALEIPASALGFSDLYTSNGFNLKSPAVLPPRRSVSLSLETLNPGADFSSFKMNVLEDIFFQYKQVSSKFNTW